MNLIETLREQPRTNAPRMMAVPLDHPRRADLQAFIADVFLRAYGARVTRYAPQLIAQLDAQGNWLGALGWQRAGASPLFLEHYLDQPIEVVLSDHAKEAVTREAIIEVGNFAARDPGATRRIILTLAHAFQVRQCRWVVCTATRLLLNSFCRLGLTAIPLAEADPGRLPEADRQWGSYYRQHPAVMALNVADGLVRLRAAHAITSPLALHTLPNSTLQ